MSSYFIKSVNFSDSESIRMSDVTEIMNFVIKVFKNYDNAKRCEYVWWSKTKLFRIFEDNIYKTRDILFESNLKEMNPFYDWKNVYNELIEKYKHIDFEEEIIQLEVIDIKEDIEDWKQLMNTLNLVTSMVHFHPYKDENMKEPFWVARLSFPDHGGDEETYYMTKGIDGEIRVFLGEYEDKLKTKSILLKVEDNFYPLTLGRTSH